MGQRIVFRVGDPVELTELGRDKLGHDNPTGIVVGTAHADIRVRRFEGERQPRWYLNKWWRLRAAAVVGSREWLAARALCHLIVRD